MGTNQTKMDIGESASESNRNRWMEQPPPDPELSSSKNKSDDDPIQQEALNALQTSFQSLSNAFNANRNDNRFKRILQFRNIACHISCNYFYETAARFNSEERLHRLYDSLKIGDKFIAKVVHLFKRSAEVQLVWSPKRDVHDLKIKANLHLWNGQDQNKSQKANIEENLDVSELIFVEVVHIDRNQNISRSKIDVIRSRPPENFDHSEEVDEIDEDSLRSGKYRTITHSQQSFHEYMMDHNDLRNPSLIKLHPFTSLVNCGQTIRCLEFRKINTIREQKENKINQQQEKNVEMKSKTGIEQQTTKSIEQPILSNNDESNKKQISKINSDSRKRLLPSTSDSDSSSDSDSHTKSSHHKYHKHKRSKRKSKKSTKQKHHHRKKKKSISSRHRKDSSSQSSTTSSESSSSSSDDSRSRHRHKRKSHKSQHKHSKRKHSTSDSKTKNNRNIDDKIIQLLNSTN